MKIREYKDIFVEQNFRKLLGVKNFIFWHFFRVGELEVELPDFRTGWECSKNHLESENDSEFSQHRLLRFHFSI